MNLKRGSWELPGFIDGSSKVLVQLASDVRGAALVTKKLEFSKEPKVPIEAMNSTKPKEVI